MNPTPRRARPARGPPQDLDSSSGSWSLSVSSSRDKRQARAVSKSACSDISRPQAPPSTNTGATGTRSRPMTPSMLVSRRNFPSPSPSLLCPLLPYPCPRSLSLSASPSLALIHHFLLSSRASHSLSLPPTFAAGSRVRMPLLRPSSLPLSFPALVLLPRAVHPPATLVLPWSALWRLPPLLCAQPSPSAACCPAGCRLSTNPVRNVCAHPHPRPRPRSRSRSRSAPQPMARRTGSQGR